MSDRKQMWVAKHSKTGEYFNGYGFQNWIEFHTSAEQCMLMTYEECFVGNVVLTEFGFDFFMVEMP